MTGLIIVHRGSKGLYDAPVWHHAVVYKDYLGGIPYKPYSINNHQSEAYLCGDPGYLPHYSVPMVRT